MTPMEHTPSGSLIGKRYRTGNYGAVSVYENADLADRYRIVGVIVLSGQHAGLRLGIPENDLGTRFPEVDS